MGRRLSVCLVMVLSLVVCLFAGWRITLLREVRGRLVRIHAAGLPVSGHELNAWPDVVPEAENGALVLTQAFTLLRTFPDSRSNLVTDPTLLIRTNEWSPETCALIAEYAQTNEPVLAKTREALLLPRFRYPVDYSCGPFCERPHLGPLKSIALMSALQSQLDAQTGRTSEWLDHTELLLRLAATLDDAPDLYSHLNRNAIIELAVKATQRSLNLFTPRAEACARLQAAFDRGANTNGLWMAFVGERALGIPMFRMSLREMQDLGQPSNALPNRLRLLGRPSPFLWLSGYFEHDLSFFLQSLEQGIEQARLPSPKYLALTNHLKTAHAVAREKGYPFAAILLPTFTTAEREASQEARRKLAATALAIEQFRCSTRRCPENLKELLPQFLKGMPTDPFDGAPLRYRRLARGYVVYSVGTDGHDDGGKERIEGVNAPISGAHDLPFVVER